MKTYFYSLLLASILLYSCGEEEKYVDKGVILGIDSGYCVCCGGWFINIDNSLYRFYNLPLEKDINLETDTIFPINVELDWSVSQNGCSNNNGKEIIISRIRKQ